MRNPELSENEKLHHSVIERSEKIMRNQSYIENSTDVNGSFDTNKIKSTVKTMIKRRNQRTRVARGKLYSLYFSYR